MKGLEDKSLLLFPFKGSTLLTYPVFQKKAGTRLSRKNKRGCLEKNFGAASFTLCYFMLRNKSLHLLCFFRGVYVHQGFRIWNVQQLYCTVS